VTTTPPEFVDDPDFGAFIVATASVDHPPTTCRDLADEGRWGEHLCCDLCHGKRDKVDAGLGAYFIAGPTGHFAAELCCTAVKTFEAYERP
jgi:hypothetical protein